MLNKKSALVVYIRTQLPDMDKPSNIFADLVELNDFSAEGIVCSLLSALECMNFTMEFLSKTLIGLTCDGASVVLGRRSGVASRLHALFPHITVWHCSAHRLELAVNDVVKEMETINHFKILMDKLYSLYNASNKSRMELRECASSLDAELCKIGRIIDTSCVASSFKTVEAVWNNYPALHKHFKSASEDPTRDGVTKQTYNGLALRISSCAFVNNLGMMCDALQELSELSLELQKKDATIISSHKAICRAVRVFDEMAERPGRFSEVSKRGIESKSFLSVPLTEGKASDKALNFMQFFRSVAKNLEQRLLSHSERLPDKSGYDDFIEELQVLYPQHWPEDAGVLYGQTEVESLCLRFNVDCPRAVIRAHREYVESGGKDIRDELKELLTAVDTIPISSAECERGLSQMNLICTPNRASLHTATISDLLFLNIVGPPLTKFNPIPYVKSWVAKGRRTATETRSKVRSREEKDEEAQLTAVWDILNK
ncbi:E3 SUMO-protein ligase KIAA1586-like [Nematolebias whitei]|uniref:E3 SUMO-protein ligase KIAA1586-like n=1 Tax=Nematolebias whitei TaxID=451745 RepID=UPI00189B594F|nr:E3 SUMO-protein ligase KIAA1586-like [Nematolebias whitei]